MSPPTTLFPLVCVGKSSGISILRIQGFTQQSYIVTLCLIYGDSPPVMQTSQTRNVESKSRCFGQLSLHHAVVRVAVLACNFVWTMNADNTNFDQHCILAWPDEYIVVLDVPVSKVPDLLCSLSYATGLICSYQRRIIALSIGCRLVCRPATRLWSWLPLQIVLWQNGFQSFLYRKMTSAN